MEKNFGSAQTLLLPEPHEAHVNHVLVSAFKERGFLLKANSFTALVHANFMSPFNKTQYTAFDKTLRASSTDTRLLVQKIGFLEISSHSKHSSSTK